MKAFVLDAYAKAARLRLTDHPDPQPGPRDVLVRIHSAGLNQLDSKIRDGAFKLFIAVHLAFCQRELRVERRHPGIARTRRPDRRQSRWPRRRQGRHRRHDNR